MQHIDFSKSEFKQGVRQLAAYLVSPHHEGSSEVGPAVPASVAGATAGNRERRSRGLVIAGVSLAVLLIGGIVVAATTGGGGSTVASPLTSSPLTSSSITSSSITSSPVVAVTTKPPSPTIVVVASEALPLPADANSAFCVRADIDFAALRAAADVSSALLAQIPAGSCGSILLDIATTGAGNIDWYHVQFDGVDGWTATTNVMARCVRADIDFSALRADTDLASAMLAQIPAGACDVLLVEPEPASVGGIVWLHVLWNGQRGWTAESNMQ
ncbi:MAG: hypothetical protein QOC57_1303 [Ilumatobacteraceae bacterium]